MSDDRELADELVELERAQFGNELHDGVIPLLFAASASVANLRDKLALRSEQAPQPTDESEFAPVLGQLSRWLDEAMEASRSLLTAAYPPDLDHCDWQAAVGETIHRLFPEWSSRVDWDIDPVLNDVGHPIACAAYRIVLEAIRNALQHGQATEVVVSGRKQTQALEIAIFDNGKGFEFSRVPSGHFGIRAMRCRAELISGTLEINSANGGPTTVVLLVPLAG